MKEDILYTLMSLLDGITIFMFAFGCFKVSFKDYWKEILVTNLVISVGTFLLRNNSFMISVIPLLCLALLIVSLTFYFRITVWSSIKLAVYGFVAQIIAQLIANSIFMVSFKLNYTESLHTHGQWVQLIGDGLLIAITLILQKRRIWFTTMPYDYTFKLKLNKINILSLLISCVIISFLYNVKTIENVYLGLVFWGVCLINLMYLDIKKEKSES
jgi:hypothetical protein